IAEIDTDKATMEAQALTTGVLRKILVPAGETVPLGAIIAVIAEADEDISDILSKAGSAQTTTARKEDTQEPVKTGGDGSETESSGVVPGGERTPATVEGQPIAGDVGGAPAAKDSDDSDDTLEKSQPPAPKGGQAAGNGQGEQSSGRLLVSPIAARMAAEAGINLKTLSGSGPGGRIIKRDIEAAITSGPQSQQQQTSPEAKPAEQPAPAVKTQATARPATQSAVEGASPYRDEPVSTMRATIARRLVSSIGPIPHFFLTTEIEMDRAAEMRRQINELDTELKISVNDLIIKVAAVSLIQHPAVNASFQDKVVRYYERADIGVAVAVEEGLITPVVRGAESKSVGQISREVRELAERARARRLKPEEYTGATFSVSNLGMFGIDEFTAVINPPEAAILAVGAMQPKPVVRDGQVVVRQLMRVTMSCDHRVVDGATGAKFLQTFKKLLENPLLMIV
ncbi:MAG TPA: dihydrolipoamide acetyltransferase family protein, partial [Pyrinomonadaceae bacterium]